MIGIDKKKRHELVVFLVGMVIGLGLMICGVAGIVTSRMASHAYQNSPDIRYVDAVIDKITAKDHYEKVSSNAAKTLEKRTYDVRITFEVNGKSYPGKTELVAYASNRERLEEYDQMEKGDTISVEVYQTSSGEYKLAPDRNPVTFLLYCAAIPIGLVCIIVMLYDQLGKKPEPPPENTKRKGRKQKR